MSEDGKAKPHRHNGLSRLEHVKGRIHGYLPALFCLGQDAVTRQGTLDRRLTFSLPAAYSFRVRPCIAASKGNRGNVPCAISSSTTRSTPTGASCSADLMWCLQRLRFSICSIT